jgi:hypothetical protein
VEADYARTVDRELDSDREPVRGNADSPGSQDLPNCSLVRVQTITADSTFREALCAHSASVQYMKPLA